MVVGKVYFLVVRVKIKGMYISIIRKETVTTEWSTDSSDISGDKNLAEYEIMDGAPVKGPHFCFF